MLSGKFIPYSVLPSAVLKIGTIGLFCNNALDRIANLSDGPNFEVNVE